MSITIRYFAAAKAALGTTEEMRDAAGSTIGALMSQLATDAEPKPGESPATPVAPAIGGVSAILDRCSFILNRHATTDRSTVLADGDTLDVLPPFAGG